MTTGASLEPQPLKVLIAGAGIGGLCAGLGLRQQGHNVTIFEQSRLSQETGAAIHLAPNCHGLLKRLGLDPRQHGSVEFQGTTEYAPTGEIRNSMDLRAVNSMWQHSWELIHRAHLHNALKELAINPNGLGRPVELVVNSKVSCVDVQSAKLTLENGSEIEGDVIIGADGLWSQTRKSIPGGDKTPLSSGKSAFRFLLPTEQIVSDERTRKFLEGKQNHLVIWVGIDRRLVMYPCVGGTQMNFVAIHPSEESAVSASADSWQQIGSRDRMLRIFESFGKDVAALLSKVEEPKIWTLYDMEKMPHFVHERLAILGDAAHPFLPHQAQGGAQAIEDAMSLAALLPQGTLRDDVSKRLQIYEIQRYERSHQIQEFTRISGADIGKGQALDMRKYTAYNVGHDEWHSSSAALQKHLALQNPNNRWRTPFGFGPAPGPRQPLGLSLESPQLVKIRQGRRETSSALLIRFKSSRTLLQNLLPPGFSFAGPATVCEATLLCNTLNGMAWLGGRGYSFIMLQIHGIKYTKRDGEELLGSFLPVIFENLADPIMTGRDDIGMPKLYADIEVLHQGDNATVELSWRGAHIGIMRFESLSNPEERTTITNGNASSGIPSKGPPARVENGHFSWRCVPAVGAPGKFDAEYPVFIPKPAPGKFFSDAESRIAKVASFEFKPGDWNTLPTLHNVTRVLAEIPNYGIIEAKHIASRDVDDLSSAYRIE